jgi:hypothetical protein
LLANVGVRHERYLAEEKLKCIRRKIAGGEYYFIVNDGKEKFDNWVLLNTDLQNAALYDPMLQRSGVAKTRQGDANTLDIYLQLRPGESCVVQTGPAKFRGSMYPYVQIAGDAITINGDWKLKFISGGPSLPAETTVSQLKSWTELSAVGVNAFSGTAQYSISFNKPAVNATSWLLSLGEVKESATVILNGKKLGTLIGPSYSLTITPILLKPVNELEIIVTNGMANRIIDLEKRGVEWKKFYNINMPSRLAENRGADGLFTASKWQPKPSGLLGPVTLTPMKFE